MIARNPDSDSDDEVVENFIINQVKLFNDEKYVKNIQGDFCDPLDERKLHPL